MYKNHQVSMLLRSQIKAVIQPPQNYLPPSLYISSLLLQLLINSRLSPNAHRASYIEQRPTTYKTPTHRTFSPLTVSALFLKPIQTSPTMADIPVTPYDPNTYHFPSNCHDCWLLGEKWYSAILTMQPQIPRITSRHAKLRPVAEPLWQEVNAIDGYSKARETRKKQLRPKYGKIMEEYYELDQELKRFAKLRGLMLALSRYMQRMNLVWPGDEGDYTFPYPLDKYWNTGPARSYSG